MAVSILPTRTIRITGEAREGERLACQVAMKTDMEIELDEDIFWCEEVECTVISNEATFIKEVSTCYP